MIINTKEKIKIIGLFNKRKYDEILPILGNYYVEDDTTLLTIRGILESIHLKDPDKAIKSFETALALQPDNNTKIDIILNIADCYCQHQMSERVAEIIIKNSHIFRYPSQLSNPNHNARSAFITACNLSYQKKYSDAINVLTSIIEKRACRSSLIEFARYNRGMCYFQEEKYSEAENDFQQLKDSMELSFKADLMLQQIQIEDCLVHENFAEAVKKIPLLDNEYKDAYIIKIAESAQNITDDALKNTILNLLSSISSDRHHSSALLWAGHYSYLMNQLDQSIAYLTKIEKSDSTHFTLAQNLIGCIEYQNEQYDLAKEHFAQARHHIPGELSQSQIEVIEMNAMITEDSIN